MSEFNEKGPLHPALGNKVVHMADILAYRALKQAQAEAPDDVNVQALQEQMTLKQRVFWRNIMFFQNRLVGEDTVGNFGRIAFEVGDLVLPFGEPQLMVDFDSEAVRAFFFLDDNLLINLERDPLVARWSCDDDPGLPILDADFFTFTKRA